MGPCFPIIWPLLCFEIKRLALINIVDCDIRSRRMSRRCWTRTKLRYRDHFAAPKEYSEYRLRDICEWQTPPPPPIVVGQKPTTSWSGGLYVIKIIGLLLYLISQALLNLRSSGCTASSHYFPVDVTTQYLYGQFSLRKSQFRSRHVLYNTSAVRCKLTPKTFLRIRGSPVRGVH